MIDVIGETGLAYDSVAVFSGGLDSTTLVYEMLQQGLTPHLISFNYGQRHRSQELRSAMIIASRLGLRHDLVDLTGLTHLISNSALTSRCTCNKGPNIDGPDRDCPQHGEFGKDEIQVPEGHYAEDNMKATVVPNRNMIMLSIAAGVAINNGYKKLGTGVHAGDHFVYPDCRPEFIYAANAAIVRGNAGFGAVKKWNSELGIELQNFIYAPFIEKTKADIAVTAFDLGVPIELTWSCYKGGPVHCGKCGTCVERLEAIEDAKTRIYERSDGIDKRTDHTEYADKEFWKEAVRNAS